MAGSTHVPDKLYGYTLQVRHMMNELISLDLEQVVSVEAFEDVAIESEDGVIVEQIKSVQSSNNPVADRAEVFWKTLYNWLHYVKHCDLSLEKTIFRIIVSSDRAITKGDIPSSFNAASNEKEAETAIESACSTLWGSNGELKSQIPAGYSQYLDAIFNSQNKSTVIQIIKNMHIEIYESNYDDSFYKKFCSQTIPEEYAQELFVYMLGWVYESVNNQIKAGQAAFIRCKEFRDELLSQIRRYNQNVMLASISVQPNEHDTQQELNRQDVYIKQLGFIDMDISEKLRAANDFLRTSAEKTLWAERGIIVSQSFDDYHDSLIRTWNNQNRLAALSPGSTDSKTGQKLYYSCQEAVRSTKVEGKDTPDFFGAGTLHALANDPPEEPRIGWHRQYKNLLKTGSESDE
ncbi:MAG: hypothetical protein M0T74_17050 [Desulfitobacterium hafniense]|nr:hypothetical protein [Desulfitobacterium hafniense]